MGARKPRCRARIVCRRIYLWACDRLYHEFAWSYDAVAWGVSGGRWAAWRRSALPWVKGPAVLEIGFGTGVLLREMADAGYAAAGVDASRAMLRQAQRHRAGRALSIQSIAQVLPMANCTFDTVVSTFPAPYISEAATIAEIARVLKPAGRLVVAGIWVSAAHCSAGADTVNRQRELFQSMGAMMSDVGLWLSVTESIVGGERVGLLVAVKAAHEAAFEEKRS